MESRVQKGVPHVAANTVVTPLRKVATYEPRIKDKLRKSKRIHINAP